MEALELGKLLKFDKEVANAAAVAGLWGFLKMIAILCIGAILVKIAQKFIYKILKHSTVDEVLHTFFANCVKLALWVVILSTALQAVGISPTSLLTLLGAAGVAVALALKDSLGNFAGGILIIATKPFSKGDFIEDLSISGKVEKIDLLYTTLLTLDNKSITIPNGKLANSTIINYSGELSRRVDCTFTIGYDDDIAKAKEVLRTVAESNPAIYTEPEPVIGVSGHGDNAVHIDFRVWCDTDDYWDVFYFVNEQVKLAFDVADISIPYPQMDVHVVK